MWPGRKLSQSLLEIKKFTTCLDEGPSSELLCLGWSRWGVPAAFFLENASTAPDNLSLISFPTEYTIFISDFWEIKWFLQFCNKELNKNFRFLRAHPNPFLVFQQMVLGLSLPSHWNAEKNKKEREGGKKRTMDKRQSEDNESQNYKLATTYPSFRAGTNLRVL